MPNLTDQDLENGKADLETIEAVANGPASGTGSTVTSRLGQVIRSVAKAVQDVYDAGVALLGDLQTYVNTALAASSTATTQAGLATTAANFAQASARTVATWNGAGTNLLGLTPTVIGQGAEVLDSDLGTHTDPQSGLTVPNAGRYTAYALTAGAWTRIGATGLSGEVAARTAGDAALSQRITDGEPVVGPNGDFAFALVDPTGRVGLAVKGGDGHLIDGSGVDVTKAALEGQAKIAYELYELPESTDPIVIAQIDSMGRLGTYLKASGGGSFTSGASSSQDKLTADVERQAILPFTVSAEEKLFVSSAFAPSSQAGSYPYYFTNAMCVTKSGRRIVVVEARASDGDLAPARFVYRYKDPGGSWSAEIELFTARRAGTGTQEVTKAPMLVYDRIEDRVWLKVGFLRSDVNTVSNIATLAEDPLRSHRVYYVYNDFNGDPGKWRGSAGTDITLPINTPDAIDGTNDVRLTNEYYCGGPGRGLCASDGRCYIPSYARLDKDAGATWYAFLEILDRTQGPTITRRDGTTAPLGKWTRGGQTTPGTGGLALSESTVYERKDGSLRLYSRSETSNKRIVENISTDKGLTWSGQQYRTDLLNPQVLMMAWRFSGLGDNRVSRVLLLNNFNAAGISYSDRIRLSLLMSYDEGDFGSYITGYQLYPKDTETVSVDELGNTLAGGPVLKSYGTDYASGDVVDDNTIGILFCKQVVLPNGSQEYRRNVHYVEVSLKALAKNINR